jgi:hypothetical protein
MQLNQTIDRDPKIMFVPPTKVCCEHEKMEVVRVVRVQS